MLLIGIALAVLLFGTSVYLLDRPAGSIRFLPPGWTLHQSSHPFYGALGGNIPSLAHALCFSLITSAALGPGRLQAAAACLTWGLMNVALEAGQHPAAAGFLAGLLEPFRAANPAVGRAQAFFLDGVFDPLDLVGILMGAATAHVLILSIDRGAAGRRLGTTGRTP